MRFDNLSADSIQVETDLVINQNSSEKGLFGNGKAFFIAE